MLSLGIAFFATTGFVAAQTPSLNGLGLSQPCQTALQAAIDNPSLSPCLNLLGAIPVVTSPANASLVQPFANWLNGLCAAQPCDNSTLSAAAQNISAGCQSDLASHETAVSAATILNTAVQFYPVVREVACLKDTGPAGNGELCVTELITAVQTAIGQPLSINTLEQVPQIIANGVQNIKIPQNVTCSSCTQAAWSIVDAQIPSVGSNSQVTNLLTQQCGASFVSSTTLPSNIVEGTGTAAPQAASSKASAAPLSIALPSFGLVVSVVSSMFAVLVGSAILI